MHVFDTLINSVLRLKNKQWSRKLKAEINLICTDKLDKELIEFIKGYGANDVFARGQEELNWIIQNPWVTEQEKQKNAPDYFFSWYTKSFQYHSLKFQGNSGLIAFILMKERDKRFEVVCNYFRPTDVVEIIPCLIQYLVKNKAESFTSFDSNLVKELNKYKSPFLFKKQQQREVVAGTSLSHLFPPEAIVQDGDGDVAFA